MNCNMQPTRTRQLERSLHRRAAHTTVAGRVTHQHGRSLSCAHVRDRQSIALPCLARVYQSPQPPTCAKTACGCHCGCDGAVICSACSGLLWITADATLCEVVRITHVEQQERTERGFANGRKHWRGTEYRTRTRSGRKQALPFIRTDHSQAPTQLPANCAARCRSLRGTQDSRWQ